MNPSKTPELPVKSSFKPPRLSDWLLITLVLLACVWAIAPQQLPVSLYKLSLVTLAAVVGYWIDRSLFPYARPDVFLEMETQYNRFPPLPPLICDAKNHGIELRASHDGALLRVVGVCMLRRAIIVGCAMLAMGLGA